MNVRIKIDELITPIKHSTWTISRYSTLAVGKYYSSHSFQFKGESWHLRLYPGQPLIVCIVKEASATKCLVECELTVGNICKERFRRTFGVGKVIAPCFFPWKISLESDQLTIFCCMKSEGLEPAPEADHMEKLSQDMGKVLVSEKDCNFTVLVKGEEFHLDRTILSARSPVFHSMLQHNMAEKETGTMTIDDCEPDVFRVFAQYIYTGRVQELTADIVFELFVLADKYQVGELELPCIEFMKNTLSVQTFSDVAAVALQYQRPELLSHITDFLSYHIQEVIETQEWRELADANQVQMNELLYEAFKEKSMRGLIPNNL